MINFDTAAHWYGRDGSAQHDAGLKEARKNNLYPSVTTIDKEVFKNIGLERYRMNQLVMAACANPRQPHETDEGYSNRIYQLSLEHSKSAAEFGSALHDAIEHYPQMPLDTNLVPWLDKFGGWYSENISHPLFQEKVLLDHDLGVAGRCDFIGIGKGKFGGKTIVPDWKTQDVKKDDKGRKKPNFYTSWGRQLAFYAVSYAKEKGSFPMGIPTCISVVIDSNEPEEPFVKVWTDEEIKDAYMTFVVGAWLYFSGSGNRKPFWPQQNGEWKIGTSIPLPFDEDTNGSAG
jgi:hypothetical protein